MKRKILLSITAVVLLLALGLVYFSVMKDGPQLIVETPSADLKPGDEFEVSVVLENNPGIAIFCLWMDYDDTRFDYVSVTNGPVLDAQSLADKDGVFNGSQAVRVTNGLRVDAFHGNGVLYTVKFRVKDDATPGSADFAIIYREGDIVGEPKQPDNQPNNYTPETVDGTVNVLVGTL